jgi:hypothetical protein
MAIKKSLACSTWYGLASLGGCGRWNAVMVPLCSKRTRDPRPSITRQPSATNSAAIRAHSSEAGVGLEKMAFKVLVCLAFMDYMLSKNNNNNQRYLTRIDILPRLKLGDSCCFKLLS